MGPAIATTPKQRKVAPSPMASDTIHRVSVVIPVYGNAASLPELFERLESVARQVQEMDVELEAVFVDDGSADCSFSLISEFRSRSPISVTAIRLSRNFGGVNAIKVGLRYATGGAAVIMAADLQDPPEQLPMMIAEWLEGHSFVVCERSTRTREDGFIVRITSRAYHAMVRWLIIPQYPPGGFDMMLVDRQIMEYLRDSAKAMYPQILALWLGFEPRILYYDRPSRPHGRSQWSTKKRVAAFSDVLFGYSSAPIQAATLVGAFVAAGSLAFACVVLVARLTGSTTVPGYAVLAILISSLSGLILIILGVLGQYIWRIYDEISGRPDAVVAVELLADAPVAD